VLKSFSQPLDFQDIIRYNDLTLKNKRKNIPLFQEDTIMSDDNAHLIRKCPIAAQIIFDMAQSIRCTMP